jgi:redox-sensitive bicupin YhaK (pirin superfamily)
MSEGSITAATPTRVRVVPAHKAEPAPGLVVDRPLPAPGLDQLSPFLMLDHFGPTPIAPGTAGGLNPHPHRGFETVTLLFDGAMEHRDSSGGRGTIRAGGVQWMTAARGIVHAEYHAPEMLARGGTLHGVQLWVNLPRRFKGEAPGYQDLPRERIPERIEDGVALRVIAGELSGLRGPARTYTPLAVAHFAFAAEGRTLVPLVAGHHHALYVVRGGVRVEGTAVPARHLAVIEGEGEVAVTAEAPADALFLAGEPIAEPVVAWGPFVMSTREEIVSARQDFLAGRMGRLDGVPF